MFESMRMLTLRRVVFTAAFGVMLASCSGVYGPKGNDAGGIIPAARTDDSWGFPNR